MKVPVSGTVREPDALDTLTGDADRGVTVAAAEAMPIKRWTVEGATSDDPASLEDLEHAR